MTLPFFEFEPEDTSHLSMEEKPNEVALEYFKEDTVLITSALDRGDAAGLILKGAGRGERHSGGDHQ